MRYLVLILLALVLILGATAVAAAPGPGITPEDAKKIMPVSQVKAGMKGYGLTVFRGTKIERFNVEVIGVLKKVNVGRDLILVKMSGGPITARGANIIQGMSGSPVFINDKMIGAVAYGEGFPKEPIGLLTPIEDMLEALDPALPDRPSGHSSELVQLSEPVSLGTRSIESVLFTRDPAAAPPSQNTLKMMPLMTPLMVSGMSARGIERLRDMLGPYNLSPMAGPGTTDVQAKADLVPGSAVGLALTTGDIELVGIGTLTYRRGNKIVAFGHPMLGIGAIDVPMTTAYVHDIFPSMLVSSKIASALEIKGRIFQDRPFSVGGEIGRMAEMIPVKVYIDDQATKRRRTMNINVMNHPLLASRLIAMVAGEAVYEMRPTPGDATAKVRFEIEADKVGRIERENIVFDHISVDSAAIEDMQRVLSLLSSNRFHPVDIKSVKLAVTITGSRDTAVLESAFVEKTKFEPGETVDVGLVLRPYKQERVTKYVQVEVPEYAPNGRYTMQISGGGRSAVPVIAGPPGHEQEGIRISGPGGGIGAADNIQQMIQKFLEQEKNNELVAKLLFPTSAPTIAGQKLSRLPDPLSSIVRTNRATGIRTEREEIKAVLPTEFIVTGNQSLQITVERRSMSERRGTPQPESPGPPPGEGGPPGAPGPPPDMEPPPDIGPEFFGEAIVPTSMAVSEHIWSRLSSEKKSSPAPEGKPAASEDGEAAAEPPSPPMAPAATDKPIARQPQNWRQGSYADFNSGVFDGTTVTTKDELRLTPRLRKETGLDQTFVWSLIPDGADGVYAGTGPDGKILRLSADGTVAVIYDSDEISIHSLLRDQSGSLYAGTSPNGLVYRVSPDGRSEVVFDAPEMHVIALAQGPGGEIYAGVGDGGNIYRISGAGEEKFASLPDPQVLSLTSDTSGNLYAGTGPNGIVYRITPEGQVSPVYDAAEPYISAVSVQPSGQLYVGTAPKGVVYRIAPDAASKMVLEKSPGAITALVPAPGGVYASTEGQIFLIGDDDRVAAIDTGNSRVQFTSLALDASGRLRAGASNPAAIYANEQSVTGTFESPVRDAKLPSRWGAISWVADTPPGTIVGMQTRTGNSANPDVTWSEWSAEYRNAEGESITSPAGRFIQYRTTLTGTAAASPAVRSVSIVYLTQNQPPKVAIAAPQTGARWSGKQTVRWSGTDPDKDVVTYDVYYSSDNGATWKALRRGVRSQAAAAPSEPEPEESKPAEAEAADDEADSDEDEDSAPSGDEIDIADQLRAEVESNPRIPRDIKDRILAQMPEVAKEIAKDPANGQTVRKEPAEQAGEEKPVPSKETSYAWDTTSVPDGRYTIKVLADDRTSNAEGYLTGEKISDPFIIANKPPRLVLFRNLLSVEADRSVIVPGYSYHGLAEIAGVQYKVDSGDWAAASADDGIFDSIAEAFTVRTQPLAPGERTVEVKVIDAAGNSATAKVTATVGG